MPSKRNAKHIPPPHAEDLRRVYESLGRIDVLEGALSGAAFTDVTGLIIFAHQQLIAGHVKDAAELLRAAEHLSFAALAPTETEEAGRISADLKASIAAELDRLSRNAERLWDKMETPRRGMIATLYALTLEQAHRKFIRGAYQPALELARAAEAIAHVEHWDAEGTQSLQDIASLAS